MSRYALFFYSIMTALMLYPLSLLPGDSPDENNSIELNKKLMAEITENRPGIDTLNSAARLLDLAPYTGRYKVITAFDETVKKIMQTDDKVSIKAQVLRLLADELEANHIRSIKNFSVISKWNVSGSWTRYGLPDYNYEFQPQKAVKIEDIEKGENLVTAEGGEIFPFKIFHGAGETAYLTCSFTCEEGIRLWIISDSVYRLIVNGKELFENEIRGSKEIKAYSLKGARGYTIQIKVKAEDESHHPFMRAMITDEKNFPAKVNYTGSIFSYSYTPEKLYSLNESKEKDNCKAVALTDEMNELCTTGNYYAAYKLGTSIIAEYPFYARAYGIYMQLLDIMNRDNEYHATLEAFRKNFPDADIYPGWLAEFYMTRDRGEFVRIMKTIQPWNAGQVALESYVYMLCAEKKYSMALELCSSIKKYPEMSLLVPRILRESGDISAWRKSLLSGITGRNNAGYYYDLGLAEMLLGIDPVMYWEKGLSLGRDSALLRDISDIYENGLVKSNDFYKGIYTDLHPEFLWYSKKRKISLYISSPGKIFIEGEDIIPSGKKFRKMEYAESGLEFSGTHIKTAIPRIGGLKILYVLTAFEGLPSFIDFKTGFQAGRDLFVEYKATGNEEFSVVKYSGLYTGDKNNIFMLAQGLRLKSENEKISDMEYEVFFRGDFIPMVNYKGAPLAAGKNNNGLIRYISKEKFSDDDSGEIISDIFRFPSDIIFSQWYGGIISGMNRYKKIKLDISGNNTADLIKKIHFHVMTRVSGNDEINFCPGKPDYVLQKGRGTVEERTLLAKIILENNGIKSFISFIKNRNGIPEKIMLYVPGSKGKGLWVDFYNGNSTDNFKNEAIIITSQGCEKIPVNKDAFIR